MTNRERAEAARTCLLTAHYIDSNEWDIAISDLVCDLLHLNRLEREHNRIADGITDHTGSDSAAVVARALNNYLEERQFAWDIPQ